jgi:hypothetical protein
MALVQYQQIAGDGLDIASRPPFYPVSFNGITSNPGGTMNREWHKQHRMPTTATEQQRLQWHLEHTRNCSCRPFPESLLAKLTDEEKRQMGNEANHRSAQDVRFR